MIPLDLGGGAIDELEEALGREGLGLFFVAPPVVVAVAALLVAVAGELDGEGVPLGPHGARSISHPMRPVKEGPREGAERTETSRSGVPTTTESC